MMEVKRNNAEIGRRDSIINDKEVYLENHRLL